MLREDIKKNKNLKSSEFKRRRDANSMRKRQFTKDK
jgi:hypothetical protein